MAPPTKVPDKTQLRMYLAQGLTQQEIVTAWEAESGLRVARSAIALAIERNGLQSARPRPRYSDLLPWKIAREHRYLHDARMLRLEGRRRAGRRLSEQELRFLELWKQELRSASAVVHYERDTEEGFFWIPRERRHGSDLINRFQS